MQCFSLHCHSDPGDDGDHARFPVHSVHLVHSVHPVHFIHSIFRSRTLLQDGSVFIRARRLQIRGE
ncbi:MAG TPA: hypothetical protein VJN64_09795 [Terriglobales bacterium]|nr:hypothetical protein [Terriglobales bacterium]